LFVFTKNKKVDATSRVWTMKCTKRIMQISVVVVSCVLYFCAKQEMLKYTLYVTEKVTENYQKTIKGEDQMIVSSYSSQELDTDHNREDLSIVGVGRKNSTIGAEVLSISHDPLEATITIKFMTDRRCLKPVLKGRLAGPFLSIITFDDWKSSDELLGRYNVPSKGHYFIEIISLLCNDVQLDGELKGICLENPIHHRITSEHSFIIITKVQEKYDEIVGVGSWSYTPRNNQTQVPLYTRYQPPNCRGINLSKPRCTIATNLTRFEPYSFSWNEKTRKVLSSLRAVDGRGTKMCFIGWSHTRVLIENLKMKHLGIHSWQKAHFVSDVNEKFISNLFAQNCTKIILGLGQWDLDRRVAFSTYMTGMTRIVLQLKEMNSKQGNEAELFVWNMHYNPIGDNVQCPSGDRRLPPFVDSYNSINQQLCYKYNVTYINTQTVMGPVWDRASDWNHYRDESSRYEGVLIYGKLFRLF